MANPKVPQKAHGPSEANNKTQRPPVVVALVSQCAAFLISFGLSFVIARSGIQLALPLVLGLQGVLAAIIGIKWGLARWWVPLHLILPMAGGAAIMLDLPSWIFLAAFILLALVFWNALSDRVLLYLSNRRTWAALSELLPSEPAEFIDIGCGIGGTLTYLAKARPDCRFTGIESAPIPFALAYLRIRLSGASNIDLRYGDFWKHDLSSYDVAYAFLSPAPMPSLFEKVQAEMRAGTRLVSNSFPVPGYDPDETLELDDQRRTQLMIWEMPGG